MNNRLSVLIILLFTLTIFSTAGNEKIPPVASRTVQVRDAIVNAIPSANTSTDVTTSQLGSITVLDLRGRGITELQSGDFSGLTSLTNLNLYNNELSSLPDGIFEGLTALTTLRLGGNTVTPLPVTVSLEKVVDGQFRAVAPAGASFDIVFPFSVANGSISGGETTLTIIKGSTESNTFTVTRTAGSSDAVTVDIETLPGLPTNHYGYALVKSTDLPLEVISGFETSPTTEETPALNAAPTFIEGSLTVRSIAENTAANANIGTVVAATDTDNDTLTYTLGGTDASMFSIDTNTAQLKTKSVLDYETKRIFTVTITVSDGSLTATISVIISVIDVAEMALTTPALSVSNRTPAVRDAIVASVPGISTAENITVAHLASITELNLRNTGVTELKTGDFSGLSALTSLNLYGNLFSRLPVGVFEGLTVLTSLRLGGNLVDPMLLIVSLQQIGIDRFRALIHTGAPFDVVLPINNADTATVTIPKGSVQSPVITSTSADVSIGALPTLPINHYGYILAKSTACNRTSQVSDSIVAAFSDITECRNVTDVDISRIRSLNLSNASITLLDAGDFEGMLLLKTLDLSNNQLTELPDRIFEGLFSLIDLNLSGNTAAPLLMPISLEKVGSHQFKVVVPMGTPFNIQLPISVTNGSVAGDVNAITLPVGTIQSMPFAVTRTPNTIGAVMVDFGTLPNLPASHSGYALVKSDALEIFGAINVAPVFTEGTTTIRSIAENTAAGRNIGNAISATDANNDTLTYSLVEGASNLDAVAFDIDNTRGQLKTKITLDYESKNSYSVAITVSDGTLTDTINVTINIIDIDENVAPIFTEGDTAVRTVAENTPEGRNIGSAISATDANNDTLTYTLSGSDAAALDIDKLTGHLKTKTALDYETKNSYSVTITVSDGAFTDTINVTINITDVDENRSPVFAEGDTTTRTISENTDAGVNIGNPVSATDLDKDTLIYSLVGNAAAFDIVSTTGQLKTKAALDYETRTSYSVSVSVSDGKLTDTIAVTINITDVDETPLKSDEVVVLLDEDEDDIVVTTDDDEEETPTPNNVPVFTDGNSTMRSIAENTDSGVDIGSAVSATDADGDTLTYTFAGTDASSFTIDSSSGQLRTYASLDYETKSTYSVTISVSDGKGGSDSISVTINITNVDETVPNSAPVFASDTTTRSVAENTAVNTNIGAVITATDADNDTLTYGLNGPDAASFSIDVNTGQLKTKIDLNHETKDSYLVTVSVSDGKGGTDSISVTINVLDVNESPEFTDGATTTRAIAENVGTGINIGTAVSATDPDDGDTLTYTLGGTDGAAFDIGNTAGQLKTKAVLDYETKNFYLVIVTVSDGTLSDTITVTINVTNLDETPSNNLPVFTDGNSTTRTVAENTVAGTNIGDPIAAIDVDNNILTYLLSGDDASSFSIVSTTGQLQTRASLNHESKDEYEVMVTVSDGSTTDTITVTISVTDVNEAPVFVNDSITRSVAENTVANTNIGSAITATDPDGDNLTYTLGGTDATSFDIDEGTGQLKTKKALDFESKRSYAVTITAKDEDNLSDSINLTINITDVDENRVPVFTEGDSTTRSVTENTGSGVNIGIPVSATDTDEDTLEYTLGGTDAGSFRIGSTNGQLRTRSTLNYENKVSYVVTITAEDGNNGEGTIDVTINVTDVNDAPVFTDGDSTTRSIAENTATATNIETPVSATDEDQDTLTYTFGGTDADSFAIDTATAQLKTKNALDYEIKSSYSLTITAMDGNSGEDTIDVTINVTDAMDPPIFTDGDSTIRSIAENTAVDTNIGTPVSATDADQDTLTYTLGGTDAASFDIVSTTGQLKTKTALDHETKSSYTITITVDDQNGGEDTINVTVNITDVTESLLEGRSSGVRSAILSKLSGVDADDVTAEQLASITAIVISTQSPKLGDFDGLTGLVRLSMGHNLIRSLPAGIFDDLVNLEYIGLGLNLFETLPAGLFNNNTKLKTILLGIGELRSLPAGLFDNNTELTKIDLRDNKLPSLPAGFFDNNTELVTLDLSRNQIHSLPTGYFDNNTKLKNLHLNRNGLHSLSTGIFDNLTKPTSLNLDSNNLETLPAGVFDTLTLLNTLELRDNELTTLPSNIFDNNTALTHLYLQRNDLTSLPSGVFDKLTNLTRLDLNDNELSSFSTGIFDKLTNLTFLKMYNNDLTSLPSGIFDKFINLTRLDLRQNGLTSLPDNIFKGLTELSEVKLDGNTVDPLSVIISLVKVESGKFKATVHTGAPFDINFPITVVNGSLSGGTTSISISTGSIESNTYTVTRTTGTTSAVTVNIGTLPAIPSDHSGYALVKPTTGLPLIVIDENVRNTNSAPEFTEGASTTRSIAENTAAGQNIGSAVTATDIDTENTLTYTLGGTDVSSFDIVSTSGQLQTKAALDYETKSSYTVTVSVYDDDGGKDSITVTISVTNVVEISTPVNERTQQVQDGIVDAIEGVDNADDVTVTHIRSITSLDLSYELIRSISAGDFDDLTALTTLNLSSNSLSSLPSGIFDDLTALTTLDLSSNSLSSLPSDIFSKLTKLAYLYLYENSLSTLSSGLFKGLTSLSSLFIEDNTVASLWIMVSLEKVADGQFKAVCPIGAPFDIAVPLTATNGTISDNATSVTISTGTVESGTLTITRTAGTTGAVAVDIGTLPLLPSLHDGYRLVRTSSDLPLTVIDAIPGAPIQVIFDATALLPNYPNPFNPETWIPYQLAKSTDVTLTIYNMRGIVVRKLSLGHKPAGFYRTRQRAIHWDGRNVHGEKVANGVYFYYFKAGHYSALRKMLILK